MALLKSQSALDLVTPVLFLVYKRLDTVKLVFESIRMAKPRRLYIASDGPKENNPEEESKVQGVRNYVLNNIDWICEVKTLFRKENMGCKKAVSEAIDWFFENEAQGIILEDDILPHRSFFIFCQELLERYKNDERVGQISGFNYGYNNIKMPYDYFYSKYVQIWGWATWKRAWRNFDIHMAQYEETVNLELFNVIFHNVFERRKRLINFQKTKSGEIDSWGYIWSYTSLINGYHSIIPKCNLIENIGFGKDATHTRGANASSKTIAQGCDPLSNHPEYLVQDKKYYDFINKSQSPETFGLAKKIKAWID